MDGVTLSRCNKIGMGGLAELGMSTLVNILNVRIFYLLDYHVMS